MKLVKRSKEEDTVNLKRNINLDSILKLQEIIDKIEKEFPLDSLLNNKNKNNGIKLGKVEKYNLEKNPLTKIIAEIINNNKFNLRDKQLAVDKALINFDLN